MYLAGRWADRQLSRLELVASVILLGIVVAVMLVHMLKIFAVAERSLLISTVINIETAIQYRAAGYVLRNDYMALDKLTGMNPLSMAMVEPDWFTQASASPPGIVAGMAYIAMPGNYLGEFMDTDPAVIKGGNWYFDQGKNTLVYRVNNAEYFFTDLSGPARVEFVVEIDYVDKNADNRFNPRIDDYRSIRLQAVNDYEWRL